MPSPATNPRNGKTNRCNSEHRPAGGADCRHGVANQPAPCGPPEAPAAPPDIIATINSEAITRDMLAAELAISRLNVTAPLPPLSGDDLRRAEEEALNQLITRHLILQAAARQNFALDAAAIERQAELLFGAHGDAALNDALRQANATRADLLWWVGEITTVEEFITGVIMKDAAPEDRQQVYNEWLNARQAEAAIRVFDAQSNLTFSALPGHPAPDFELDALTGDRLALSQFRGRVVLINFWATWCPSCTAEMPEYEQVYQRHNRQDFTILAVNLQENRAGIRPFVTGMGLSFPVLLDETGDVTNTLYQIVGLPGSVLVNADGIIVYRHIGPMSGDLLEQKLAELGL